MRNNHSLPHSVSLSVGRLEQPKPSFLSGWATYIYMFWPPPRKSILHSVFVRSECWLAVLWSTSNDHNHPLYSPLAHVFGKWFCYLCYKLWKINSLWKSLVFTFFLSIEFVLFPLLHLHCEWKVSRQNSHHPPKRIDSRLCYHQYNCSIPILQMGKWMCRSQGLSLTSSQLVSSEIKKIFRLSGLQSSVLDITPNYLLG